MPEVTHSDGLMCWLKGKQIKATSSRLNKVWWLSIILVSPSSFSFYTAVFQTRLFCTEVTVQICLNALPLPLMGPPDDYPMYNTKCPISLRKEWKHYTEHQMYLHRHENITAISTSLNKMWMKNPYYYRQCSNRDSAGHLTMTSHYYQHLNKIYSVVLMTETPCNDSKRIKVYWQQNMLVSSLERGGGGGLRCIPHKTWHNMAHTTTICHVTDQIT
jgi:hypothetical protein